MRTRRRETVSELRRVIECLPRATRAAMLEGVRAHAIIVGAYSDGGGICPMLAAHRAGGRTNMIAFAHAWDRFAFRGSRTKRARRATERELLVLRSHLEASLLEDEGPSAELATALQQHRELHARSQSKGRTAPVPGRMDVDRTPELRVREGWAWLRVFRRYDEYERALARVKEDRRHAVGDPVP